MFSCLLLHSGSGTEPIVAEKSQVSVQAVGHVGRGEASFQYELDGGHTGLLLYVPSLIHHRNATRQRVRLSGCTVRVQRGGESRTHTFHLTSFNSSSEQTHIASALDLPEHASLKGRYKDLVSSICGAHSNEDVLLHLDDVAAGSQLTVRCEFLVQFCPTSAGGAPGSPSASLEYRVHNKLHTKHLSYSINLASALKVQGVCPLFPDAPTDASSSESQGSSTTIKDFHWTHLNELSKNVVHVEYEHQSSTSDDATFCSSAFSSGLVVTLSGGVAAACCTGFTSRTNGHSSNPYDGVLMVDNTFTGEQLPAHLQQQSLFPSEFVFVIDCSGSMSGTNIQSAADTLITCVKSLPVGCYFNVVAFGSTFRQLFHASEPYSKKSVERALQFANQLQASLGGTELLAPLKWIFRRQRCTGLPCQVLIVTDGGVINTQAVLHTVRKNRQQARCHTFGIGPEVCVELVKGIAVESGGQCVLLEDGERLQTKVMEVLKESLQPSLTNTVLRWNPPEGYSVVDSSPRNLGTLHSNSSYTAYAFLRREQDEVGGTDRHHGTTPKGSATISGTVGGEDVEVNISQAVLPELSEGQSNELWAILWQTAVWSKLSSLEMQILSSSRKNSHDENDKLEPAAKRPRLNGMSNSSSHYSNLAPSPTTSEASGSSSISQQDRAALCKELTELSIASGVPCSLTHFTSDTVGGRIKQITPNLKKTPPDNGLTVQYQKHVQRMYPRRKRPRSRHRHHHEREPPATSFTFSSLAKSSISAVGSTLKSVVNFATFGLLSQETTPSLENGQRIEDELELHQNKDSRLHWDNNRGQIVYPSFYYRSSSPNHSSPNSRSNHHHKSRKGHKSNRHHHGQQADNTRHLVPVTTPTVPPCIVTTAPLNGMTTPTLPPCIVAPVNGMTLRQGPLLKPVDLLQPGTGITVDRETGIPTVQPMAVSEEEDDEFTISDSESDSSLDPDWEDLRRPNQLLPLIHMQLFGGAWPMVRAFSYAVGVPLEEIRRLPLRSSPKTTPSGGGTTTIDGPASPVPPPSINSATGNIPVSPQLQNAGYSCPKVDDESNANFWTTALAIACLEEYFSQFRPEWELVACKGQRWLRDNGSQTELSMDEVERIARELVLRQS